MSVEPEKIIVTLTPDPEPIIIEMGIQGPPGIAGNSLINGMLDVDITVLSDGAILIWNEDEEMWVAGRELRGITIDAGVI